MVKMTWRVYGANERKQRESFNPSYTYDFSNSYDGTRVIEVRNHDITGTHYYTEVAITRNTKAECKDEMSGQITDGIFEDSRVGRIVFVEEEEQEQI